MKIRRRLTRIIKIFALIVSILWRTYTLFDTKSLGPKGENIWTFGQVVPLVLLLTPLLTLGENFLPLCEFYGLVC
jgi:hypothetical protein